MEQDFYKAHKLWLDARLLQDRGRPGTSFPAAQTRRVLAFLQNVWWPEVGSFDHLHPQVEAAAADGARRIGFDLAYLRHPYRIGISLGRRATHHARLAEYWIVLRFTPEQIRCSPDQCRQRLRGVLMRLYPNVRQEAEAVLTPGEKEIARLAVRSARPITPADVSKALSVCDKTARAALKALVGKQVLQASGGGGKRIRSYVLACEPQRLLSWLG